MIEPENVVGQMKNNRGFRRFLLRGLPKVSLEVDGFHLPIIYLRRRQLIGNTTWWRRDSIPSVTIFQINTIFFNWAVSKVS
jgi:hypothetical protein